MVLTRAIDTTEEGLRQKVATAIKRILAPGDNSNVTDVAVLGYLDCIEDIVQTVDHLLANPEKVASSRRLVERDVVAPQKQKANADEEPWPEQYGLWEKIPNYWVWQWISQTYEEFDSRKIAALQKSEKKICRTLLEFGTGMKDKMAIDTRLRDKQLMSQYLFAMAESLGHPLRGWVSRAFKSETQVDWSEAGVFTKKRIADGMVRSFQWSFDGAQVIVPEGVFIQKEATIVGNFKYTGAHIVNPMGKSYLSMLLTPEQRSKCEEHFSKEKVKMIIDGLEDKKKTDALTLARGMVRVNPDVMASARKRRRTKAPAGAPEDAMGTS